MKLVMIVAIPELDVIGHIFPDKPRIVHYVKDGVKHESSIKEEDYIVLEEVEISQEEI